MEDSSNSSLNLSFADETKHADDIIPVLEEEASSSLSSIPSLLKGADNYVRGIFSGFMGSSTDDDSVTGACEKEEDEEEEDKPLIESMKDSFKSLFDKRGVAILGLIFLLVIFIYMYKNGHFENLAKMLPLSLLTGEEHEEHHHAHSGCTCKNKGAKPAKSAASTGECPCQKAKRMAEEAAKKAAELAEKNDIIEA
ncbi:Uncharacterized protein PCOAH_00031890 [Plasmodium coatneyi]|uniref:Uncharacterized protein n=1 Tax=Plasmodium coatneyi TaxID=208452 RepID=A0A1B1E231_9APIC|nr:Uncharacterized protein PCOAH_00031890 [Plasmodium coatneyi]ANQ09088.1 Uncharacterized protein PCOAH_00031890 [Plasmodium coatneyi]